MPDTREACRKIIVPTDRARIGGGPLSEFTYRFIVNGTGGAYVIFDGVIQVNCSERVKITLPAILSPDKTTYPPNSGL
jgi:hypothetical protein